MGVMFKVTDYATKENILFLANQPYVDIALTLFKDSPLAVTENGRKIVKAGTIFPANDATAQGLVHEDYDVTDGDVAGALIIFGFVDKGKLPVAVSSAAATALKGIFLLPYANTQPV